MEFCAERAAEDIAVKRTISWSQSIEESGVELSAITVLNDIAYAAMDMAQYWRKTDLVRKFWMC
ncbi:hypothetical protein JCM15519_09160 [Fundidesulfovibrio butyratiphilus]